MKHIIGEARWLHEGYNSEKEVGVICKCGKCIYIKKEDREPITHIECPECGFIASLYSGRIYK